MMHEDVPPTFSLPTRAILFSERDLSNDHELLFTPVIYFGEHSTRFDKGPSVDRIVCRATQKHGLAVIAKII